MKTLLIPAAMFAAAVLSGEAAYAQLLEQNRNPTLPPTYRHEHDEDRSRGSANDRVRVPGGPSNRVSDQTTLIRQRADAVANEVENIQAHLEDHMEEGHADQATYRLFYTADSALQQTIQFRRSIQPAASPEEVYEQFRALDQQIHGLMQAVQASNDPTVTRDLSRLAYADERLHAVVATGAGQTTSGFIARQAHVLATEAQQLERAARVTIAQQDGHAEGGHRGDAELIEAIHVFADRVEHFHETAEHENDRSHLAEDFTRLDQSWQRVVELMNRNPHGAYLSRRAQRVGAMHDDLSRVIGVKAERRSIRFNIGGVGVDLGR